MAGEVTETPAAMGFALLAMLAARELEPDAGATGWLAWAEDAIPPDVLAALPEGYLEDMAALTEREDEALWGRVHMLPDDEPTEQMPRVAH